MSDSDSKRYYWLRLKKDFFHQHQIKVLKSLPNGRLYALIYLELMAESTSHEGQLRYSKLLPYDIVTLAAVIDEDKDNVEQAVKTLVQLELVEILDDGTIFLRDLCKLIGSETGQTIRKREAKLQGGKTVVKHTLEYRDKSKSIDIDDEDNIKERFKEAGYDDWILDRAIDLIEENGVALTSSTLSKVIDICENESIANPEGYVYKALRKERNESTHIQ
ncbi:MAG: phage replisome organizer N-terminal domain-containing protein [Lachnospiraceae bacterium]|nr:phage replisome organizer N-terminal domain-containing protein [Lachnospiraceae bacterium]